MERYAPSIKDLAPRDMVSRAIMDELKAGRGIDGKDYIHLDLSNVSKEVIEERLPEISSFCNIYLGIDPSESPIPVLPTAHHTMGGIPADVDGRVLKDEDGGIVGGLYAAGECACLSIHGANRLGCNSLLDTVVFGRRAGIAVRRFIEQAEKVEISAHMIDNVRDSIDKVLHSSGSEKAGLLRAELQKSMMEKCSVFRDQSHGAPISERISQRGMIQNGSNIPLHLSHLQV